MPKSSGNDVRDMERVLSFNKAVKKVAITRKRSGVETLWDDLVRPKILSVMQEGGSNVYLTLPEKDIDGLIIYMGKFHVFANRVVVNGVIELRICWELDDSLVPSTTLPSLLVAPQTSISALDQVREYDDYSARQWWSWISARQVNKEEEELRGLSKITVQSLCILVSQKQIKKGELMRHLIDMKLINFESLPFVLKLCTTASSLPIPYEKIDALKNFTVQKRDELFQ